MLEVRDLQVAYGAAPALWDVSLRVGRGELVCVVGPNGAGKTTLINAIAGLHRVARRHACASTAATSRSCASHRFCAAGIADRARGPAPVHRHDACARTSSSAATCRRPGRSARASLERVLQLFPVLQDKLQAAGRRALRRAAADGGDRPRADGAAAAAAARRAVARPVAARSCWRCSTPSARSTPQGTSVLLVEQNVAMALGLAHRAYVLEEGRIVAEGLASELVGRPEIQKAYLGLEAV